MKKQTSVVEKQYQKFESNSKQENIRRSRAKSNLYHSKNFTFYKYYDIYEFVKPSPESNGNALKEYEDKLEVFYHDTIDIKSNNKD